jgi:alanine racemase
MNRAETARVFETGPSAAEAGGCLTIDLTALAENWRMLGRRALPAQCAAVVKADAYGCGIEPVARALARAGCRAFFVAQLDEARRVRSVAPEAVVYVLNGFPPGTAEAFAEARARPVIGSMVELAEWEAFTSSSNWDGGAALQIDTGMTRLGITPEEAIALADRMNKERHGITLLMSHFACAETPGHPLNQQQIGAFRELRMAFRGVPASLANSSGAFLGTAAYFDMIRPGVALYGGNPTPGRDNPMLPVVELKARVVQIRTVPRGQSVGYGGTWTAKRPSRLAIVAVGYGDGYPRAASASDSQPGANAVVAGQLCPIAGRISMDLMAVDVTALPEGAARRGDLVTLLGERIGVDDLAGHANTISYEVLTNLGRRFHRVYRGV